MAIKKRKVIMNGNNWGEYSISFKSYIKLQVIRLYLWSLRWVRRFLRGVGYCKYVFAILPVWAVFLVIIKVWGTYRLGNYSWSNLLWDMKASLFSSVILTAATSFITQYTKQKTVYIEQHELYIQVMDKMSCLFKNLNVLIFNDISKELVPFWPFYTEDMSGTICDALNGMCALENKKKEAVFDVACSIEELKSELKDLRENIRLGKFDQCNYLKSHQKITYALRDLAELEKVVVNERQCRHFGRLVSRIYDDLYELLDELRKPWRRDVLKKVDALKIIYREDTSIADTFYNSAFLKVIDYQEYEDLLSYVERIKKNMKQTKEHALG